MLLTDKTFLQDYNPRLSAYHFTDPLGAAADYGRLAALSRRQGRPQLFRRPLDLFLRLLDRRRAEPNPGHPSGDRLRLHRRPSGARRRAQLQHQLHQPDAPARPISTPITQTALMPALCANTADPWSRTRPTACCAAFPAPTTASRPRRTGGATITDSLGQHVHAVRLAARRRRAPCRSTTIRACPTTSTPATPIWCAPCRPSAWNTAIPFISVQSWGTQTIEPIAQVIARPNETAVRQVAKRRRAKPDLRRHQPVQGRQVLRLGPRRGRRPRQLRAEYTAQFNRGGSFNALFGQSYSCSGQFIRAGRHHQYRPRQRPRHHPLRLRGARLLPAEQHL